MHVRGTVDSELVQNPSFTQHAVVHPSVSRAFTAEFTNSEFMNSFSASYQRSCIWQLQASCRRRVPICHTPRRPNSMQCSGIRHAVTPCRRGRPKRSGRVQAQGCHTPTNLSISLCPPAEHRAAVLAMPASIAVQPTCQTRGLQGSQLRPASHRVERPWLRMHQGAIDC